MSHAPAAVDLSDGNLELAGRGDGVRRIALFAGIGCLVLAGLGTVAGLFETPFYWRTWLVAWLFVLQISLGGLFFVFVTHITRAGWSVAIRRPAEVFASNLNWLWILGVVPFLVLLFSHKLYALYPWADLSHVAEHLEGLAPSGGLTADQQAKLASIAEAEVALIEKKSPYLNLPFFMIRGAFYLAVWAILGTLFYRASVRQDTTGEVAITARLQKLAAPTAILFGLTTSFAAFDWLMSMSPAWFSTMFGVYFFAGCATVGFSSMILACLALQRSGRLTGIVTAEHYQDMGKFLFAFGMVFWAYIGFSQYMLIWYANIPEETGWFMARQLGGWLPASLFLLFGHFIIPFLFFISKHPKRRKATLVFAASWMLVFGVLDLAWLALPEIPPIGLFESYGAISEAYSDLTTGLLSPALWLNVVGMLGLFVFVTIGRLDRVSLLARRDPRLADSLAFENQ